MQVLCFNPVISPTQEHSQVIEKWTITKPSVSNEVSETVNDIPVPGVTIRDSRIARVFSRIKRIQSGGIHTATGNGFNAGAVVTAMWHKIVSERSHLALSIECDCLPAIAGLARQTETCKTGKYLAGLWEDSLAEDLLWRVYELLQGRSQKRPKSYQAPTWSWASVNGKVSFWADKLRDYQLKILKTECTPVRGADCFGK